MVRPDEQGETPAQLKKRADDLRECARRARTLAGSLGPYLDKAVSQATPAIWKGPFADASTATLGARKSSLHSMASDLMADARRWETEASNLDDEARKAQSSKPGR
ncbi:hypothetical protein [Streptomyces sp. HUAS TT20]|uniref:hypothetical protein n=1 Tax=Streptomyces sp. HUAS TT20 TaxID=3447509 RepID=UPI0021DAC3BA|nr:hypothetical protein [Streptomyces sp. HUAS 15-9]UXY29194.1 hypothetical protein N8I87_23310 [Streptomyces sp. HUAS 15-9]